MSNLLIHGAFDGLARLAGGQAAVRRARVEEIALAAVTTR
jgi:hypothetical protein